MNLQSLASVLVLLQAFVFYGGSATAQGLADPADSQTAAERLRDLVRNSEGLELRVALNSWRRSLPDPKSALTNEEVSIMLRVFETICQELIEKRVTSRRQRNGGKGMISCV